MHSNMGVRLTLESTLPHKGTRVNYVEKKKESNTYNNGQLIKTEQLHQTRNYPSLDHHLNTLVSAVRQV